MTSASAPGATGRDAPAILLFPPLIPLGVVVIGLALDWAVPLGVTASLALTWRLLIAAPIFVVGFILWSGAVRAFRRNGTNVNPSQPALALARDGVYRWSRNPMYVGGLVWIAAVCFAVGLDWVLLLNLPGLLLLHYGVVLPEERYLEAKFGDDYRGFKASVPRYLGI